MGSKQQEKAAAQEILVLRSKAVPSIVPRLQWCTDQRGISTLWPLSWPLSSVRQVQRVLGGFWGFGGAVGLSQLSHPNSLRNSLPVTQGLGCVQQAEH